MAIFAHSSSFNYDNDGHIISKGFYFTAAVYLLCSCIVCFILEPNLALCDDEHDDISFQNPAYKQYTCRYIRFPNLLYLTIQECAFGRSMIIAVILGSLIGWERRREDRPAAIRTMVLVSLGSCLLSICSTFAFISGPMEWDSARVSAAIPSGVGFLGAGLIFKNTDKNELGDMEHTVHGITTAVSLWISAAAGIACAGELYFAATYSVGVMMLLLRFGPRSASTMDPNAKVIVPPGFTSELKDDLEMGSLASLSIDNFTVMTTNTMKTLRGRITGNPLSSRFHHSNSMRSMKSRPQLME